jgi:hypothetical protein
MVFRVITSSFSEELHFYPEEEGEVWFLQKRRYLTIFPGETDCISGVLKTYILIISHFNFDTSPYKFLEE